MSGPGACPELPKAPHFGWVWAEWRALINRLDAAKDARDAEPDLARKDVLQYTVEALEQDAWTFKLEIAQGFLLGFTALMGHEPVKVTNLLRTAIGDAVYAAKEAHYDQLRTEVMVLRVQVKRLKTDLSEALADVAAVREQVAALTELRDGLKTVLAELGALT